MALPRSTHPAKPREGEAVPSRRGGSIQPRASHTPLEGGSIAALALPEVRVQKGEKGIRLEWQGERNAVYLVSRCFVAPGLEACEEVETTRQTSWTDEKGAPPFALATYRVTKLAVLAPSHGAGAS